MKPRNLCLSLLLAAGAACAPRTYGPTHTVDAAAFKHIQKMGFLRGDTAYPEIADTILSALSARYTQVTKPGTTLSFAATTAAVGRVPVPPPSQAKVEARGARFGDCPKALAQAVEDKAHVDAVYVLWVVDWSGSPIRVARESDNPDGSTAETSNIHREVVAEICAAGSGRELWHTVEESRRFTTDVRAVSYDAYEGARRTEIQQVIESLWAAFWL